MNNINPISQKFFLYARKSTDVEDKQILSIEAQLVELREFAKRENLEIIEEFIEKQTAKIPGRPIFNSMLEKMEKGEAWGILSWHPDRLARNSVDGGRIIYMIDTGKIKFLKFPQFWFESTPQGKFMLNIAFGQSKYYVDSLSENTKRGLRQKVRRGEMPGRAPFGYLNDSRIKRIVIDKKKAVLVKKLFEKFATGNYLIKDMVDFLAENGILAKSGKKKLIDWVSHKILSNPFYYGHFRYNGEIYEGKHEPIIAKKLFDQAQEVLDKKYRPWSHAKIERIPKAFLGLLRCGECGMMITAEIKKKFYKTKNRHASYTYYRCTKKSKTQKCHQSFIREEELNQQLSSMMQKVSLRRDWAKKMLEKLENEKKDLAQSGNAFITENQEKINLLKQKLQLLLDSYLDQIIEREIYLEKKVELMGKVKTMEEQNFRFSRKQNDWLEPMKEWINEAVGVAKIAKGNDLFTKKVLAAKIFGSNLTLEDKKVRGLAQKSYAALRAAAPSRSFERAMGIGPTVFSLGRRRLTGKLRPRNGTKPYGFFPTTRLHQLC